ncbi:MAG: hypothetical protein NTV43_02035 [Methylococcales bacterium]|nr:hypothetical protein [Methylococcales bacterium]
MLNQIVKSSLLGLVFFIATAFTTAHAASVNGGWLADNGDILFIVKSTKGKVVVMDVTDTKTLRYVFTGTMSGDKLDVSTADHSTSLVATVTGEALAGVVTDATGPQDITASLYFAYKGSNYDGVWKTPDVEQYALYASLKLKGVATTLVPFFTIDSTGAIDYDMFIGAPASTDVKGNITYSGLSYTGTSLLNLVFTSTNNANANLIIGKTVKKFTMDKIYAVTPKSGEF